MHRIITFKEKKKSELKLQTSISPFHDTEITKPTRSIDQFHTFPPQLLKVRECFRLNQYRYRYNFTQIPRQQWYFHFCHPRAIQCLNIRLVVWKFFYRIQIIASKLLSLAPFLIHFTKTRRKTKPFENPRYEAGGVEYDSDKSYDRRGKSRQRKVFRKFRPWERKASIQGNPLPCFSLLLNSSGQGRDWKERENGNFHSKANSAFSFGGEDGNRLDVYRSRFFDSKPVPFPGRNVSTEPISEWLMRVSRVNGVYRWTSWWNARVKC